jgi:hypothetical protein
MCAVDAASMLVASGTCMPPSIAARRAVLGGGSIRPTTF